MTLQLILNFLIYEENLIFFFISVLYIPLIILFKITASENVCFPERDSVASWIFKSAADVFKVFQKLSTTLYNY
jgi:hypothetical protein